jgi:hypothetical protein
MRSGEWCDTVNGEHGFSVEVQEHMPTGYAGRETSHNSGSLYAKTQKLNFLIDSAFGPSMARKETGRTNSIPKQKC